MSKKLVVKTGLVDVVVIVPEYSAFPVGHSFSVLGALAQSLVLAIAEFAPAKARNTPTTAVANARLFGIPIGYPLRF